MMKKRTRWKVIMRAYSRLLEWVESWSTKCWREVVRRRVVVE
jgi:hypothetical protein